MPISEVFYAYSLLCAMHISKLPVVTKPHGRRVGCRLSRNHCFAPCLGMYGWGAFKPDRVSKDRLFKQIKIFRKGELPLDVVDM